jgi:DNA-directed RNA polymerase specialized sigma24 family protein
MQLDDQYRLWALERSDEALGKLLEDVRATAMAQSHDEDVAQNVVITIMSKLDTFKPQDDTAFTRYVMAVTTKHRLKVALEWKLQQLDADYEEVAQEEKAFVSISDLPAFGGQIANSILAGYSLKDIADQMKLKESTLRKKLFDIRNEKSLSTDI